MVAVVGARPDSRQASKQSQLDQELLLSMHRCLLGAERDLPSSWSAQGFPMRDTGLACGLRQWEGGPCGVLAVVQGFIIRQLLVEAENNSDAVIHCNRDAAGAALISALATIIWNARVGRLASVVVCKRPELPPLREAAQELVKTECNSLDAVTAAVRNAAGAFIRPRGAGVAMLLYSVLLTRGLAMVQRDADFASPLIGINSYCAQELVNLLLVGRAHSNVFDGERTIGEPGEGTRLRGIPKRAPIGFLTLFERQGEPGSLVLVGRNLKLPLTPVFIVQSESHYSCLWAAHRCLALTFGEEPSAAEADAEANADAVAATLPEEAEPE